MFVFLKKYDMMMQERVMILEKKTFEISNIQSVEE